MKINANNMEKLKKTSKSHVGQHNLFLINADFNVDFIIIPLMTVLFTHPEMWNTY